ncbi:MAG TPA: hypothetical protein VH678_32680 [Xanthobacteraceae bacterium]|jgi:hypothetical protein
MIDVIRAALTLVCMLSWISASPVRAQELRKQYWATSLSGAVDDSVLQGLYEAALRGDVGWLDVDWQNPIPSIRRGINLILYHVGGNCYIGSDCDRFPSSEPTGDRWGKTERMLDLTDAVTRKIVVEDLIRMVRYGDDIALEGSIVGVHLDNVHRLNAHGIAQVFNELLRAVKAAQRSGLISKARKVGYVAKNNPKAFRQALEQKLLDAPPLYQINENARLDQAGVLDPESRIAQQIGKQCSIPVFLKTFGSDIAYTVEENGEQPNVFVTEEMAAEMAQLPDISGVAWSADEARYHPTAFVQGSPVRQVPLGSSCTH